jgi:hypothetical protein
VRARLWELMRDQTVPYLLQECVVYMPADVLEGVELIDAPGTGVVSPQEQGLCKMSSRLPTQLSCACS